MNWEMIAAICAVVTLLNLGVGAYLRLFISNEFTNFGRGIEAKYVTQEVHALKYASLLEKFEQLQKRVTKP